MVYIVLIVRRGKGCTLIFFLLLRGRGVEVNVIFFPSLEMWKEEGGNGYIFFWKRFFHCGVAREGKGVMFFYKFIMGGGVGFRVAIKHSWVFFRMS